MNVRPSLMGSGRREKHERRKDKLCRRAGAAVGTCCRSFRVYVHTHRHMHE